MRGPYVRTCAWYIAHGTEVAVSFYFTHTGIVNYCIPAGRISATLLTTPFLALAWRGLGTRLGSLMFSVSHTEKEESLVKFITCVM